MPEISSEIDAACKAEGWGIFTTTEGKYNIQRIDKPEPGDGVLPSDEAAYQLVIGKALQGSKLHLMALMMDGWETDDCMVPTMLLS
jgi:hypothetical protein